jgi:hypothetical protein
LTNNLKAIAESCEFHFPNPMSRSAPLFPQRGRPGIDLGAGNAKRVGKVRFYPRTGCHAFIALEFPIPETTFALLL